MADPMRLYTMPGSPYGRRVELALTEKGLAYEMFPLSRSDGDLQTEEHLKRSPHGRVPALIDGDVTLYESQVILDYLEDRYPEPPLMPSDAAARAQARVEEFEALLYYLPVFAPIAKLKFMTPPEERDQAAINAAVETLAGEQDKLETRVAGRGGDYILGAGFSRADLSWLTTVEIAERGGLALDAARFPWLAAWRARLSERPSYEATYPANWK